MGHARRNSSGLRRLEAKAVSIALGLSVLLSAGAASAFCQTTTCDVDNAQKGCTWDADGCATSGHNLFWPGSCGWFGVQKDASPLRKITYETMHAAVTNAFLKWSKADCGTGTPSFDMQDTDQLCGPVVCPDHEFNKDAANVSSWMFRDGSWPYVNANSTIALTTLSVGITTGQILDADVEINSFQTVITTSDVNVIADLESIVTHEAGHFLGLAHSAVPTATMFASYSPASVSIRTLSPDDEQAICTAYPPGKTLTCGQPEPLYGLSVQCGGANPCLPPEQTGNGKRNCATALGAPNRTGTGAFAALLIATAARIRRRRPQT